MKNAKEVCASLNDAYENAKRDDGTEYTRLNEKHALYTELKDVLFAFQDDVSLELSYKIMGRACIALADHADHTNDDDLQDVDAYELANDTASVYTASQLDYIDNNNQSEIADIVREYDCDIGQAAAIWYEQKVAQAIELLLDMAREVISESKIV